MRRVQELGQEAVSGVDLLCRTSAEFLRELAETDIGDGGGRVLASFVTGVYRAPGGRWVTVNRVCKRAGYEALRLPSLDICSRKICLQGDCGLHPEQLYVSLPEVGLAAINRLMTATGVVLCSWTACLPTTRQACADQLTKPVPFIFFVRNSRRGSISASPAGHSPGAGGGAGIAADDRRNSRAGAGAGAEAAVAKALSLLPLLLELHPRPAGAPPPTKQKGSGGGGGGAGGEVAATSSAADAAVAGQDRKGTGVVVVGDGQEGSSGRSGAGASESGGGDDELEAILGALLAVIRGGSASNREAALSALGSKVLPRLGGAAAGGREWLGELITDEDLLVAAIEDRSSRGAACHLRALGLTYKLLASSPELMSLALEPGCPLLPAVLDALGDGGLGGVGGETPSSRVAGGAAAAAAGAGTGVDGSGSSHHHRRVMSGNLKGGDVTPGTPRSAPRTPRLTGMPSDQRRGSRGGPADNEAAGRSGLAVLRIVGLVRACACACVCANRHAHALRIWRRTRFFWFPTCFVWGGCEYLGVRGATTTCWQAVLRTWLLKSETTRRPPPSPPLFCKLHTREPPIFLFVRL